MFTFGARDTTRFFMNKNMQSSFLGPTEHAPMHQMFTTTFNILENLKWNGRYDLDIF